MGDFNDTEWDLVDVAVAGLYHSWNQGESVDFEASLPPVGHASRTLILTELIKSDQELRWRAGTPKFIESYLSEWPELRQEPGTTRELLESECATRAAFDKMPSREALRERFPGMADEIDLDGITREAVGRSPRLPAEKPLVDRDTSASAAENTPADHQPGGELAIGAMFGRYEILGVLGIGGMGKIYRAKDTKLSREVALKIPHLDKRGDSELVTRFKCEAHAAAQITHSHVCPIYDFGEVDGIVYLTMAFIRGEDLAARIKINELQNRRTNQREMAEIVMKVAQALEAVHHGGLVHRDIKPSNILIDAQSGQPLLADFGLVRGALAEGDLANSYAASGTLPYMSPEQIDGDAELRSDLYSLGVVLYEAVTGQKPFEGEIAELVTKIACKPPPSPRTICPDVEPRLEAIILKSLAKKPEERFQSAGEMAAELKEFLQSRPQGSSRPPRRIGARALLAAAVVALFFAGVVIYIRTNKGTVEIRVKPDDAKAAIRGQEIVIKSPHDEITLQVGEYIVDVTRDGYKPKSRSFTVKRGVRTERTIELDPEGTVLVPPPAGWPSLKISRWIKTIPHLTRLCLSGDDRTLYAANWETGDISLIQILDVFTGESLRTIPFGKGYCHGGIALSADERYLFTTNFFKRRCMSRIDLKNHAMTEDLQAGGVPDAVWAREIDVTPDKQRLIVGLGMDGQPEDSDNNQISIVDITNGIFSLAGEVRLMDEAKPTRMAFTADSKFAYVVTRKRKSQHPTLYEIQMTPPYRVARKLAIPDSDLAGVAVLNRLKRIFVSDQAKRRIWIVDSSSFEIVDSIKIGDFAPGELIVNRQENLLAVISPETKRVFLLDPAGSRVLGQVENLRSDPWDERFTGDGKKLLVSTSGPEGGVAIIDLKSVVPRDRIVFSSNRDGGSYQIYCMNPDGSNVASLTDNHATNFCPRWSPDGRSIAFVSNRDGPPRIFLMDSDGQRMTPIDGAAPVLSSGQGALLAWSPDGNKIAFVADEGNAVRTVDVATGRVTILLSNEESPFKGRCFTGVTWNKSDGMLLVSSVRIGWDDNQVFRLDPTQLTTSLLYSDENTPDARMEPAVSPNGNQIVAAQRSRGKQEPRPLLLLDMNGNEREALAGAGNAIYGVVRWTADGKHLVYSAGDTGSNNIFVIGIGGQKPTQLTSRDRDNIQPDIFGDVPESRAGDRSSAR
jgi:serine/threonine protein kinase/DNA-binding beta-propeller fold protein YncE